LIPNFPAACLLPRYFRVFSRPIPAHPHTEPYPLGYSHTRPIARVSSGKKTSEERQRRRRRLEVTARTPTWERRRRTPTWERRRRAAPTATEATSLR
jgi:hypothetical protein